MSSYLSSYLTENFFSLFFEIDSNIKSNFIESGTLELSNLLLRSDLFYILNIPYIKLINSYIGKLNINISENSQNKKISASIDNIFIHIKKKNFDEIIKEEEINYMQKRKVIFLEKQEKLSVNNTFGKKSDLYMIQYILDNINLTLNNIVIKFDDTVSFPKIPCCMGIILEQINISSKNDLKINKEYEESSNSEIYETIQYKLIKIKKFSIYFDCYGKLKYLDYDKLIYKKAVKSIDDQMRQMPKELHEFIVYSLSELYYNSNNFNSHQFILFQINLDVKIDTNGTNEDLGPKFNFELNIPQIILNISITQIHLILKFIEHIRIIKSYQIGILKDDFYQNEMAESDKKTYIKYYMDYYKNKYIKKEENIKCPEIINKLDKYTSYENIYILRLIAQKQVYIENNIEEIEQKIKKEEGRWFGKNQDLINKLKKDKENMINELNQIKYYLLMNKEKIKEQGNNELNEFPEDNVWIKVIILILITSCTIYETIKRGDKGGWEYHNKIIDIALQELNMINEIKKDGYILNISVENIVITEEEIQNKNYNKILFGNLISQETLFDLKFEIDDTSQMSNKKLSLYFYRPIYIIFNIYTFNNLKNYIIDMILPALNSIEILSSISNDIISKSIYHYNNQSLFISQNNISLDILLKDLYIIFPINIHDIKETRCILINIDLVSFQNYIENKEDEIYEFEEENKNEKIATNDIYYIDVKNMKISLEDNCIEYNNYKNESRCFLNNFNLIGYIKLLNNMNDEQINFIDKMEIKFNVNKFYFSIQNYKKILIRNYLEEIDKEIKKDEIRMETEEIEDENLYLKEENEGEGDMYNEENEDNCKNYADNIEEVIIEEEEEKSEENNTNNENNINNNEDEYYEQESEEMNEEKYANIKESEVEENIEDLNLNFTDEYPEKNGIENINGNDKN
jgi:hypothetical protein